MLKSEYDSTGSGPAQKMYSILPSVLKEMILFLFEKKRKNPADVPLPLNNPGALPIPKSKNNEIGEPKF